MNALNAVRVPSFLDRFVRQCLCLLSAVVSQGAEAARDVFSQIHVSKGLISLARRRDKTVSALQTVNYMHINYITFAFILLADTKMQFNNCVNFPGKARC